MVKEVEISPGAKKQLRKLPQHVVVKFLAWVQAVQDKGLEEVRKVPGFHDEPVKGNAGQRSIRLSKGYRAYYRLKKRPEGPATIEFVYVEGVDKHEYGK
jgi:toxin HigB-1